MPASARPERASAGLRILGRMIARAYLGEIDRGEAGPKTCLEAAAGAGRSRIAAVPSYARSHSSDRQDDPEEDLP
jgi:hypothetical protein